MTGRASILRGLAIAAAEHAARMMPADRASWAQAMRSEPEFIDSDRAALGWAVGCLVASYSERIGRMELLRTRAAGLALALVALWRAIVMVFAPAMIVAYRIHSYGAAQALGARTPGDDYHRFIPLMNATPLWLVAIWALSGLLYVLTAGLLLLNRRGGLVLALAAMALEGVGFAAQHLMPALAELNRQTFASGAPNITRDFVIPAVQLLLLFALGSSLWWREGRSRSSMI